MSGLLYRDLVKSGGVAFGLALVALFTSSSPVRAAFIVQTFNVPQQDTNVSTALAVQQFDTSQGTLTRITFTISGVLSSQMFADIEDPTSSGTVTPINQVDGTFDLRRPDDPALSLVFATASLFQTATLGPGDFTVETNYRVPSQYNDIFAPPDGIDPLHFNVLLTTVAESSFITTGPADLSVFTGPAALWLDFFGNAQDSNSPGGGQPVTQLNFTQAGATVTVTYEFDPSGVTPVPAPATVLLFGLGGLVMLGRSAAGKRT